MANRDGSSPIARLLRLNLKRSKKVQVNLHEYNSNQALARDLRYVERASVAGRFSSCVCSMLPIYLLPLAYVILPAIALSFYGVYLPKDSLVGILLTLCGLLLAVAALAIGFYGFKESPRVRTENDRLLDKDDAEVVFLTDVEYAEAVETLISECAMSPSTPGLSEFRREIYTGLSISSSRDVVIDHIKQLAILHSNPDSCLRTKADRAEVVRKLRRDVNSAVVDENNLQRLLHRGEYDLYRFKVGNLGWR